MSSTTIGLSLVGALRMWGPFKASGDQMKWEVGTRKKWEPEKSGYLTKRGPTKWEVGTLESEDLST